MVFNRPEPSAVLVAMARDFVGFLFIKLNKFRSRLVVDPQQLIELGMQPQAFCKSLGLFGVNFRFDGP